MRVDRAHANDLQRKKNNMMEIKNEKCPISKRRESVPRIEYVSEGD